tara:strand:+ start:251 stop:1246 length:996 start_codon:yes stop_codon:yes gene_type:complete
MPNMNRFKAILTSIVIGALLLPGFAPAAPVDIITFDLPGKTIPMEIPANPDELRTYLTQLVANGSRFTSHEQFDLPVSEESFIARQASTGNQLTLVVINMACGDPLDLVEADRLYSRTTPAYDGIGKVYMGRQISQVMGHLGAGWLDRSKREQEERTDLLVEMMSLKPNEVVADIGSGTGYFSLRLAKRVPEGGVVAVDIQPEMNAILEEKAESQGVTNIKTILGTITDTKIPAETVDVVLFVDAYHEFSHPWEMKRSLMKALKPGGRVVLVEYRAEDPDVMIKPHHKMAESQALLEFEAAGFEWIRTMDDLPQQHVLIFEKPVRNQDVDG